MIRSATLPLQTTLPSLSDNSRLKLFSGSANVNLSREVARYLGIDLGPMVRKRFADGELYIQIQESIRGSDVYLMQPTCYPVNDHLMELLIMVDACRRASARQIAAVIPYYGYARADRKTAGRESITAKLAANIITAAGADRVLAMDLHSAQIQGYFDIPCDHVYASPVIVNYIADKNIEDLVVVSPDVGGVARARPVAGVGVGVGDAGGAAGPDVGNPRGLRHGIEHEGGVGLRELAQAEALGVENGHPKARGRWSSTRRGQAWPRSGRGAGACGTSPSGQSPRCGPPECARGRS